MIVPRNTLVVLRLIETTEKTVGAVVVPTAKDQYCEAEVMAVGPGTLSAAGGRSEIFDLKIGQRVFVKHKTKSRGPMGEILLDDGIVYMDGDKKYMLFEQNNILGIIAEPV